MNPRTTAERLALRVMTALPAPVQRGLSGGSTVRDGQTLAADVQLMLRAQGLLRGDYYDRPIDVVRTSMRADAAMVGGDQPIGSVRELTIGGRPARHYLPSTPKAASGESGPLLLFIHGGGYIEGDVDTHDAPCRLFAELSGVPVLSVEYRLAPEHTFPAAHDDMYDAFREVHERAAELGVDPQRIAVGGDSAGGNLAAWVAIEAARNGLPLAFQLLIYPCTDGRRPRTGSGQWFNDGFYLTQQFMDRADTSYVPNSEDLMDERCSLVDAKLPDDLAPAYLCTAGFDPLRDEGERYAEVLRYAGKLNEVQRFDDQIHGFINMLLVPSCRSAAEQIAMRLRTL